MFRSVRLPCRFLVSSLSAGSRLSKCGIRRICIPANRGLINTNYLSNCSIAFVICRQLRLIDVSGYH